MKMFIPRLRRREGYTVLALSILLSILPSVTNIFCCSFFRNHASQPLQTWYGALARGPTHGLPNLGPPIIYFLLAGSAHFYAPVWKDRGHIVLPFMSVRPSVCLSVCTNLMSKLNIFPLLQS